MRATHQIVNRFLRVDQGHPLDVRVSVYRRVEVKKQGHDQFSLRFLRHDVYGLRHLTKWVNNS